MIHDGRIDVSCTVGRLHPGVRKIYVLNELGADCFTHSLRGGKVDRPPSGWEPLPPAMPTAALYDPVRRLSFFIGALDGPPNVPVRVLWGRERGPGLCWAGFEFELNVGGTARKRIALRYTVCIE